jgi:RHS repeat-associated protein
MANKAGSVISAPAAGGALQGLGEKFSADLQTGTGNFRIPIKVPTGRNNLQPELSFDYSTGNGNGILGIGWNIGVPMISRKWSQKTPVYDDSQDTFMLSGVEDLVPVPGVAGVTTYRPRTEGLFARIEHVRDANNNYWRVRVGSGLTSYYGTPGAVGKDPAVVSDPDDSTRIFAWHLSRCVDAFGAQIVYSWTRDESSFPNRKWDQAYLSKIEYLENGGAVGPPFLASVEMDYQDRPDAFSSYRAGFEIRTTRRCTGIRMYTHATGATLVRSYGVTYADQSGDGPLNRVSQLVRIEMSGHDGAVTEPMPPVDFRYTAFDPRQRKFTRVTGPAMPSESVGQPDMDMVDLFGQGLPDIVQMNGTVRYWRNLGNGRFDIPRQMDNAPGVGLADPGVQFMDANGDGRPDLLVDNDRISGYFPLRFGGHWDPKSFHSFRAAPTFSLKDPEVKLLDLDGDGVTDALRSGSRFQCFFHDPVAGWSSFREYERRTLDAFPNVNFSDPRVRFADLSGDGMLDIVLIHRGGIDYWPNLGYGRFGSRIHMRNSPRFPYNYDPKRIQIGDVDGDGADDIVYMEDGQVTLWINQCGNAWSDPIVVRGTPPVSDLDALRLIDLLGCGVRGILWSTGPDEFGLPRMSFLDFSGGVKPYLLYQADNNIGAVTRIDYASSTRYYLEDEKKLATKWKTPLPFPVQVVARTEVIDQLSGGRLTNEFHYHHGYWDGVDREFRGFAQVVVRDTETFDPLSGSSGPAHYSPPTETRTWFHLGPVGDEFGGWGELDLSAEYWAADPRQISRPPEMTTWLDSLPRRVRRDALRSLRGRELRKESYSLDGDFLSNRPHAVTETLHGVGHLPVGSPSTAPQDWQTRVFFPHQLADRNSQWERGIDPMSHFTFHDDFDLYGQSRSQLTVAVPRGRDFRNSAPPGEPYLATLDRTTYVARDDASNYLTGRIARQSSFEIVNDGSLSVFELRAAVLAKALPLRIIGQVQHHYDRDTTQPANGAFLGLPLGQIGDYGALVRTLTLVLTREILHQGYRSGPAVTSPPEEPPWLATTGAPPWTADHPAEFRTLLGPMAGYIFQSAGPAPEEVEGYFAITESRRYDFHDDPAGKGRGLVRATRDAMGRVSRIDYDSFQWMPAVVTDPSGLQISATWDYRVMQAHQISDVNGNISVFTFTPLGLVLAKADIAKPGDATGDTIAEPGSRIIYDLFAFKNHGKPISLTTIRRVHHAGDISVPAAERNQTIQRIEFCDGFGRSLQARVQIEDSLFGHAVFGDSGLPGDFSAGAGSVVGQVRAPTDPIRVLVSGVQIFDNKSRPVERYETYFDQGWDYAPPSAAQMGVKVTLFYDAAGRNVRTVNPDGSEQRVVHGIPKNLADPTEFDPTPWEAYSYDANDNAGRTHPVESLGYNDHWNTPMSIVIDSLGRTVTSVVRNGVSPANWLTTRTTYDIRGNALDVTDPLGRVVSRHVYDLASHPMRVESIDGGVRRAVFDSRGDLVEHRESKGSLKLTGFDGANRAVRLWARDSTEPVTLRELTIYGDASNSGLTHAQARTLNLHGRAYRCYDEAGLQQAESYDFNGNLLEKVRLVIRESSALSVLTPAPAGWKLTPFRVDWTPPPGTSFDVHAAALLDPAGYRTSMQFDALGRIKRLTYPKAVDGTRRVSVNHFNAAGALESMAVDGVTFVRHIAYNARGQRLLIAYGNGVMTRYNYNPQTFTLRRMRTEHFTNPAPLSYAPTGAPLQDLSYEYDLIGNLRTLHNRTPASGIPGTLLGKDALDRNFVYDPIYRLIAADGRECDTPPDPAPWYDIVHCQDSTLTRAYREEYTHDGGGNLTAVKHGSIRKINLTAGTNRVASVQDGGTTFNYFYDVNGNLSQENTERFFEWDASDRLRTFRIQPGAAEPSIYTQYFYDAGGQRVQKITRLQGGQIRRTVYIDGVFEHHKTFKGENNYHHFCDNQSRVAIVRAGPAFPKDTSPAVKYQVGDHLGSVSLVLDSAGAVFNREEFTPYGGTSFGGFAFKRYRFTGMEREEESGLAYHGARYFAPWLGRWISCDPSGMVDGPNLYQYVKGNPITQTDRTGKGGDADSPIGGAPAPDNPPDFTYPKGAKDLPPAPDPPKPQADPTPPLQTPPRTPPGKRPRDREQGVSIIGSMFPAMTHGRLMPQLAPGLDDHPEWQRFQAGMTQEAVSGAAHANLARGVAISGIAAFASGYAVALPAASAATSTAYETIGSAGLRLAVTYPRLTMAAMDLIYGINGVTLPRVGLGVGCAMGANGAYRTAAAVTTSPTVVAGEQQLAARALQIQTGVFKNLGFWHALKSSVTVGEVEVAGDMVRVVTHTSPKAYELLRTGVIALEPGEILGPAPQFLVETGKRMHSEHLFGELMLKFQAGPGLRASVGSWPLGCYNCQEWLQLTFPWVVHRNPKP